MEAAEVGAEAVFHGLDEAFVAVAVLALVLALAFGWPLVILLIDAAWLVGALVLGVAARVLFRRPWRIEAVNDEGGRAEWHVVGFRAAGEKRDEVATSLRKPTGHVTARPHTAWGGGAGAEALPEPPPLIDPAWPVDRL